MYNYYDILDIRKDATISEIRLAYKKAIHKYHPDLNKEKDTSEKFKLLVKAYNTLSNPIKRLEYDKAPNYFKNSVQNSTTINEKDNNKTLNNDKKGVKFIFSNLLKKEHLDNFFYNIKKAKSELRKKRFIEREKAKIENNIKVNYYEEMNSVELVARLRTSTNPYVRANMAKLIGIKKDKEYVFDLIKSLSDSSTIVRKEAASALGIIKDYRSLNFLANGIYDYENQVRYEIAKSLRNFDDTRAISALVKMLSDKDDEVVAEAVYSLGVIGDNEIANEIRKLYKHSSLKVKKAALEVVKILR
ncbi:MAG: DnaJ domain-containing protein [Fusobacteria bacterium]|nr:DnaJ domain-containing protein [Fusobacteriota bacterium]